MQRTPNPFLIVCSAVLIRASYAHAKQEVNRMTIVPSLPTTGGNRYYITNREPLLPSPLLKLPIGSVRPEGWLRHQLVLMSDGMTGHLAEISPWCKFEGSAWASPTGEGDRGWEEMPYWLKGFADLGYLLKDERVLGEARKWIEATLASQQPDGWFGPIANKLSFDLWPNMIMIDILQSFYEATDDPRVLPFMTRYFRWQHDLPLEKLLPESWQKVRGGDNLANIYWLYNHTGEPWLLDLAKKVHERTVDWTGGVANWHGVNLCQGFREPAEYYQQARDATFLRATERNYATVMGMYGQVPGGMFGADENCRQGYSDPRQAAETCSMVESMLSNEMLLKITGNPMYGDRCEEVAFNSLPAAMTPDLKALHYLTAPNMVQLDRSNKAPMLQNGGDMLSYSAFEQYRCCQHNVSHGWPYYAEHLWMATQGNGLAAVLYAPSEVEAEVGDGTTVRIAEKTDYPFAGAVDLTVTLARATRFPVYLRIPGWCESARASVNGTALKLPTQPSAFVVLNRTWNTGDKVRLELPMQVRVRTLVNNKKSVSVSRGPLTYSLKIGERWQKYGGTEGFPSFEVFPTTPWNYGLVLEEQEPKTTFEVVKMKAPLADQPFTVEAAPVQLRAKAKRIPQWQLQSNLVGLLQESPVKSDEPVETVTLIPMGCARLRISAFPVLGDGPDAHVWREPPKPPLASHCNPSDTTLALNDGLLPKNSNDQSLPRFTWWDHLGTTEWVQYDFDTPRRLDSCEVFWFDDTGVGQCRVPASWSVLWKDGETWRPVAASSPYGVDRDKLNKVSFEPVTTSALRVEVQLQQGFSGGMLEWTV
ncbi:MAG: glycoside hydrolase family 127 protein, partial [Armatimonadetes bacterium]|nr:glycoside hydrolase family 127 protein [Armatimonadota bacterium]